MSSGEVGSSFGRVLGRRTTSRAKSFRRWRITAVVLGILSISAAAEAQSAGFALDRFEPAERGSEWFTLDSLDLRGDQRIAAGMTLDWAHDPLVAYGVDGEPVASIVSSQLFGHVGADIVLGDRYRIGLNLPLLLHQAGDAEPVAGTVFEADKGVSLGDPRVGADVRLLGEYGEVLTVAAGLQVHVPVGNRDAYASDGRARIVPRVQAAGESRTFVYAGRLAVNIRTQGQDYAGEPFGSELQLGLAGGVRLLEEKLVVGPELYGSTVIADGSDGFFARVATPLELIAGAHYQVHPDWRVGGGVAPGLTRGFGTPDVRVLLSVDWFPQPEEPPPPPPVEARVVDRDGDTIPDPADACPEVPGPTNPDPARHGCPPVDTDGDSILDPDDACPAVVGEANEDPKLHGCPPPDRDSDGILDRDDACPDEAGEANAEDPAKHGCPLPKDRDEDGILNEVDACPDEAGKASEDPAKHGCPKVQVTGSQIRILDRVEFETNQAKIRPESEEILEAVASVLRDHPEITKVRVEGHTDSQGNKHANKYLSKRRAKAVVKWLVVHGIAKGRLIYDGLGEARPIDSNETEAGRQNNRRVEFHIVEKSGAPAASGEGDAS